jgi:hypothetical protein
MVFSTFISSNVFTNFNYLKFYLSWPSFHLLSTLKFNFPSSYLFKPSFHSFLILKFSYPIFAQPLVHLLSPLDSTVQSYPSPLPIYHPMFYFPFFHFISSIVFPRFNIFQFSIFPNPRIIHYLSNSQLLTPNMSTKRPIIVLRWKIAQQYTIPIHFHKLLVNGKVGNWF